jgi:hypothetical protein
MLIMLLAREEEAEAGVLKEVVAQAVVATLAAAVLEV